MFNFSKEISDGKFVFDRECFKFRDGWWGWIGYSGSVFQWNPELKISFAYVPANPLLLDAGANRAGIIQGIIVSIIKDEKTDFKDCSRAACNIF